MIYLAYAAAWISTAVAVGLGMYFTHSPWCLLALYFPADIKIIHKSKDDVNKDEESDGKE